MLGAEGAASAGRELAALTLGSERGGFTGDGTTVGGSSAGTSTAISMGRQAGAACRA